MDEPVMLACNRIEDTPIPNTRSVTQTCCKCEKDVWASPASLSAAGPSVLIFCLQCATNQMRIGKQRGEPVKIADVTEGQQREIREAIRRQAP